MKAMPLLLVIQTKNQKRWIRSNVKSKKCHLVCHLSHHVYEHSDTSLDSVSGNDVHEGDEGQSEISNDFMWYII